MVSKTKKRTILTTILTLILSSITGTVAALQNIENNIQHHDINELVTARPTKKPTANKPQPKTSITDPYAGEPINILLIGSDIRDGDNANYGNFDGMRSDTTILAHISENREHVELISIPRDSWVEIPTCQRSDGTYTQPTTTKFNAAFAYGGAHGDTGSAAACTIQLVEHLTGIYIDEYIILDFTGVINVVDALGGVTLNVPHPINAPKADLEIDEGPQLLDGKTALGYARARSGEGLNGSDLGRIDRQQQLLDALITETKQSITDVPTIYSFLNQTTSSLTTSPQLSSMRTMAGLAWNTRKANVEFLTVPIVERGDGANVLWTEEADYLWERIKQDLPPTPETNNEE